jgi:maltoporin
MLESFNGNGNNPATPAVAIMSAEFKGFDIAPNAVFFAGKTRQRRGDVHIVDTFFTDMSGNGAGFKELPIGAAKLGIGFYRGDVVANTTAMSRFNAEVQDIGLGGDNKLGLIFTSVSGKDAGAKDGNAFSVKWDAKFAGLDNTVWAQTSKGTAGLNSSFNNGAASDDTKWRIVETINGQAGRLGGQAMLLVGSSKDAGVKTDVTSLGGRLSYGITKNFKMVGEAGTTSVKSGGSTGTLTKFTIAPTLSTGPDFWTRPELRLYVTSAKWNTAANLQAGAAGLTGNADGKTTGTSYGAQVEWWF